MSFRGVRQSKFRHVYGQAAKKEQCYDNIRITKSSWDSTFCAVNPKFMAIITESAGGGSFLVLPLEKTGRVDRDTALVVGHKAAVLDLQWSPHHNDIIASGSEDCTVKVWKIPDEGLSGNLEEPFRDLVLHQRRVGLVVWHPTAHNILLTGGSDNKIIIWNVGAGDAIFEMELPDIPLSASWNWQGSKLVVSSKDKKVRVIDPRKDLILHEKCCHDGNKSTQAVFLRNDNIFTTGFSRLSERQYALWDLSLNNICTSDLDNSNGVVFPFYDPDTNIIYLCGKGDCMIQYVEITDEGPYVHYLNKYQSSDPQRGFGWMPKRALNVNSCEIARFYKLHAKGLCEVISMTVPRKSELFQDDLYPDTMADTPSMTAEDWIGGQNVAPVMMSLKEGHKLKTSTLGRPSKSATSTVVTAASSGFSKPSGDSFISNGTTPKKVAISDSNNTASGHSSIVLNNHCKPDDGSIVESLVEDVRKLKIIAKGHERRIKFLEEKLAAYEMDEDDDEEDKFGSAR